MNYRAMKIKQYAWYGQNIILTYIHICDTFKTIYIILQSNWMKNIKHNPIESKCIYIC